MNGAGDDIEDRQTDKKAISCQVSYVQLRYLAAANPPP
jgi:hypothetical protein